jgi:hypothetical protein
LFTNVPEKPGGSIHLPKYPTICSSVTIVKQAMGHLIAKGLNFNNTVVEKKISRMCEIILVPRI